MRSRGTWRPGVVVGAGLVAVLGAAGCGPVDRGDGLADQLTAAVTDAPGVLSVEASGSNPFPWTGAASGVVRLRADARHEEVVAVVERATEVMRSADGDLAVTLQQGVGSTATALDLDAARDPEDQLRQRDAAAALAPGASIVVLPAGTPVVESGSAAPREHAVVNVTTRDASLAVDAFAAFAADATWADADLYVSPRGGEDLSAKPASSPSAALLAELAARGVEVRSAACHGTAAWIRVPSAAVDVAREVAGARPDLQVTITGTTLDEPAPTP